MNRLTLFESLIFRLPLVSEYIYVLFYLYDAQDWTSAKMSWPKEFEFWKEERKLNHLIKLCPVVSMAFYSLISFVNKVPPWVIKKTMNRKVRWKIERKRARKKLSVRSPFLLRSKSPLFLYSCLPRDRSFTLKTPFNSHWSFMKHISVFFLHSLYLLNQWFMKNLHNGMKSMQGNNQ